MLKLCACGRPTHAGRTFKSEGAAHDECLICWTERIMKKPRKKGRAGK